MSVPSKTQILYRKSSSAIVERVSLVEKQQFMCVLYFEGRFLTRVPFFFNKTETEPILNFPCKFKYRHQYRVPSQSIRWIQNSVLRPRYALHGITFITHISCRNTHKIKIILPLRKWSWIRCSAVCIATSYGLDDTRFDSR